jgi:hypothetical protein
MDVCQTAASILQVQSEISSDEIPEWYRNEYLSYLCNKLNKASLAVEQNINEAFGTTSSFTKFDFDKKNIAEVDFLLKKAIQVTTDIYTTQSYLSVKESLSLLKTCRFRLHLNFNPEVSSLFQRFHKNRKL